MYLSHSNIIHSIIVLGCGLTTYKKYLMMMMMMMMMSQVHRTESPPLFTGVDLA